MPRSLRMAGLLALLVAMSPDRLRGQAASTLLAAAQEQFLARRLDSATTLLRLVVDSSSGATPAERLHAWVRLGVVQFYQGDSTGAATSFRSALAVDSGLQVAGLERIDPTLGAMLTEQRSRRAAPDGVFLESAVEEPPQFETAPPLRYPPAMRQRRVEGTVTVAAIIDTAGRPEPESVRIVESPDSGFDEAAKALLRGSRFKSGRVQGRPVRVLVEIPIDFELPPLDTTRTPGAGMDPPQHSCTPLCRGLDRPLRRLSGMRAPRVIQLRPRDRVADFAHVVMEAIVDTFGLIEPGSAKVVSTTAPDWVVELQLQDLRDSRYEPGEVQGKKVRVRIETSVQIRFGGRGRTR